MEKLPASGMLCYLKGTVCAPVWNRSCSINAVGGWETSFKLRNGDIFLILNEAYIDRNKIKFSKIFLSKLNLTGFIDLRAYLQHIHEV